MLVVADTDGAASAFPLSEGVVERTPDFGREAPSGEETRGTAACRVGCGAMGGLGAGAGAGAGAAQGSTSIARSASFRSPCLSAEIPTRDRRLRVRITKSEICRFGWRCWGGLEGAYKKGKSAYDQAKAFEPRPLQSSSSALTSMRSLLPHGFVVFVLSSSAAASSAQSGMLFALVETFVAPSCMPLLLLAEVRERVGPMLEEKVGVSGGSSGVLELEERGRPPGIGAEVGRSMPAPATVSIVLWRSLVASCSSRRIRAEDRRS